MAKTFSSLQEIFEDDAVKNGGMGLLDEHLNEAMDAFIALLQQRDNAIFAHHYPSVTPDKYGFDRNGRRYFRVWKSDAAGYKSVVAFIEKTTGDIYKPDSWKRPAKHVRGNIYNNGGKAALSGAHVAYLR